MKLAVSLTLAGTGSVIAIGAICFFTYPRPAETATQAVAVPATQMEREKYRDRFDNLGKADEPDHTASITKRSDAAPALPKPACANADALGVSRIVQIDTTGGPGFGFEHFKQLDFLTDKEVVLTFDDGPWPVNTTAVLKSLDAECTKAVFFPIGKHATYYPEILKQVAAAGHTVGAHTWSHAHLTSKKLTEQQVKDEVEKGFSAVKFALGDAPAPFFRFPGLQHSPAMISYLGARDIAIFSCDLDSFDFRAKDPEQIVETVMSKLDKQGKGIVLMHDFQKYTAAALPGLLRRLKAGGYKVVHMKAKAPMQTLVEYDKGMVVDAKLLTVSKRPVGSVVQNVVN